MSFQKYIISCITSPKVLCGFFGPLGGAYLGMKLDESETEKMSRYRDRSALYGRPPPPPGVKEIPSW